MNTGPSQPMSAGKPVLIASVAYTLVAYATFSGLWGIVIAPRLLLVVVGVQAAMLLLGGSRVLTGLGVAFLAALLAVAALFAAVFLVFPASVLYRAAALVGGVSTILFILFSFATASRDPIAVVEEPSDSPGSKNPHVLFEDEETGGQPGSPAKGDVRSAKDGEETADEEEQGESLLEMTGESVTEYEFDDLSDETLEISLAGGSEELFPEEEDKTDQDETSIPEDWVDAAAKEITLMDSQKVSSSHFAGLSSLTGTEGETGEAIPGPLVPDPRAAGGGKLPPPAYPKEYRMRTHYRVLDSGSGELYGVYYGDEGYASLDLVTLGALLGERMGSAELAIVKLDWSNFDEVEVHVHKPGIAGSENVLPLPAAEADEDGIRAPRFVIYDRRTIQPMREYIPEGDRPRIDRLTLYKLFPEFDFKTFEIESIRWHEDEVRIFIRGEKKRSSKSKVPSPQGTDD
ncbi:MAG: hypothetical protein RRA32_00720 [bacterium]|nr:hypothetical protein [bacterium]